MSVVHVLAKERVRRYSEVFVHLWHVHVIDEEDEAFVAGWTVVSTCFLLKWLFQDGYNNRNTYTTGSLLVVHKQTCMAYRIMYHIYSVKQNCI